MESILKQMCAHARTKQICTNFFYPDDKVKLSILLK